MYINLNLKIIYNKLIIAEQFGPFGKGIIIINY